MVQLRMSQVGGCPKRSQLEAWNVEGAPIWEGLLRAYEEGNIHEASILSWAAEHVPGGPWTLTDRQREVTLLNGRLIGHVDAIAVNGAGERVLFEAKCLASRGFQEFREKGVWEAHHQYYVQVQMYLAATGLNRAYLIARNKDTPKSRLWDHWYEEVWRDDSFISLELERLQDLMDKIERREEIDPPYHPAENWQCRPPWCIYTAYCWPEWKSSKPEVIEREDLADAVEEYMSLAEEIAALEARREELKSQLLSACSGSPLQAGRWLLEAEERCQVRLDTGRARKELPQELLDRFLTTVNYKILRVREVL